MVNNKMEREAVMTDNTAGREVTIPRTKQRIMYSRTGNREYRIFVSAPDTEPPSSGYPVIYLLDANAVFATMVEAIRVQACRPEKTGVIPAVVVGIGYETEAPFPPDRHYDFTMTATARDMPSRPDGTAWPEQGGAGAFLKFIEEDLKPEIEREFNIDTGRQTILGHSLGGLFVLHALFTRPDAFQTYVAGSPSIHWNKPYFLEEEQQFASRLGQKPAQVRVLLAVGELEKNHQSRITENTKELSERLSTLTSHGVSMEFKEFEDEGHVSVLPALISKTLRFALNPNTNRDK